MDSKGNQIALTPEEIQQATDQLITNVQDRALEGAQLVEASQAALGPSLATSSNLPGGYNYQRIVQPTIDPLVANLTTSAKQAVLRQALTDAASAAQINYENEQSAYNERYRQFQREQARRQRERQASADRQAARIAQAQISSLRGGGGGGGINYNGTNEPYYTNNGGDFKFFSSNGTPITLAQYAKQTNLPVTSVLQAVGSAGNRTAQQLYDQLKYLQPGSGAYNNAIQMYQRTFPYVFGGA